MTDGTILRQKDRAFPKVALDYFQQVRQQYDLLLDDLDKKRLPAIDTLLEKVEKEPKSTTWADVFALESAYLYAIPDNRLAAEVLALRSRFAAVVGADAYQKYHLAGELDIARASPQDLRAELLALAGRIRYILTFVPPKEQMRNKLAQDAAILTIGFFLLSQAVSVACLYYLHTELPTIFLVVFAGVLGGFLSVQQRLQAKDDMDPLLKRLQLSEGWFSVVVLAPLSGGAFACVLYWMFLAGLLSGGLFPKFGSLHDTTTATNWEYFVANSSPGGVVDYGELLVWSFIAGFAERFVPNVLTRIASQAGGSASSAGAAKVPAPMPAEPATSA